MKKLIIFFTLLCIVTLFMDVIFGFYVDTVPVFAVLLAPLTWICVIAGVVAALLAILTIIKYFKHKKGD